MSSVFTKIINGEIPSFKIAETDNFYAFLDVFPLRFGHTLVIPKKETDYIFDIENAEYMQLMSFAKDIAVAVKKAFPCKKVGMCVIGLEVPHAHIHLIPMNTVGDMNFSAEKLKPTKDELAEHAKRIIAFL
jgi:histidine triad (HIT) family protein